MTTFGRYLLERGVVRREQLEEATEAMVLFGGRLGTILVESGLLALDQLEEHLSRHLRVPRAPLDRIARPEREALAVVSAGVAGRSRVLPLWIEKRRLHVAMLDPGDADLVGQLGFATGLGISPHVVAERRLAALLERYYGIRPDRRFTDGRTRELAGYAREPQPADASQLAREGAAAAAEAAERARRLEAHGLAPLGEGEELCAEEVFVASQTRGPGAESAAPRRAPMAPPARRAIGKPTPGPLPPAEPAASPAASASAASRLETELLRASSPERVAPLVLQLAAIRARVAALFAVRDGMIQGLLATGEGGHRELEAVFVPTDAASMLAGPARGEVFFGAPARTGLDAAILRALGRGGVREAAVMPISVAGRIVYLLYADNGQEPLEKSALGALCDRAGSTWSRLIAECTRRHC